MSYGVLIYCILISIKMDLVKTAFTYDGLSSIMNIEVQVAIFYLRVQLLEYHSLLMNLL
jgi:hypothetical protein